MNFSLSQLASEVNGQLVGDGSLTIGGVSFSSATTSRGDIYVAICGLKVDGADFIDDAKAQGAVAAVVTDASKLRGLPGIVVKNPRAALSRLSAFFSGKPSERMKIIGVTGTNGKSTIHWLCSKLLQQLGHPCLRVGTLGITLDGVFNVDSLTSPDPLTIHRALERGEANKAQFAAMEVSSHGLHQHRLDDVHFDVAVFSNLTRDHLDYHGTMEKYFAAKMKLFELLSRSAKFSKTAIVHLDDEFGVELTAYCKELGIQTWTYGQAQNCDLRILDFQHGVSGSSFKLSFQQKTYALRTRAIGIHNAKNFAAAFAALLALGFPADQLIGELGTVPLAPGRLEPVGNDHIGIYVDYAHTPDALENALRSLKNLAKENLWVIFGCGGDRDRGKRPIMAKIAAAVADKVVVTSDNPRTEDPQKIVDDILSEGQQPYLVEVDRRKAIQTVITELRAGDVLLIAGKGHEDYQILGSTKVHFSDQEEARKALELRGAF